MENNVLEKARKWIAGKYDEETETQLQQWMDEKQDNISTKVLTK